MIWLAKQMASHGHLIYVDMLRRYKLPMEEAGELSMAEVYNLILNDIIHDTSCVYTAKVLYWDKPVSAEWIEIRKMRNDLISIKLDAKSRSKWQMDSTPWDNVEENREKSLGPVKRRTPEEARALFALLDSGQFTRVKSTENIMDILK